MMRRNVDGNTRQTYDLPMPLSLMKLSRFSLFAVSWLFAELLVLILWLKPGYGIADDGGLLVLCDQIENFGFWSSFVSFVQGDLEWGMFRPTYFFMAKGLYCSTQASPTYLYLFNAIAVFFVLVFSARQFYSALPEQRWPKQLFIPVFMLLTFCIYRTHDLFTIAGMQEKIVLLAGAWGIGFAAKNISSTQKLASKAFELFLLVLIVAFGFATKAQFLLFLPGIFLLLLARSWAIRSTTETILKLLIFSVFAVGGALWIRSIATQGGYTSSYSFSRVVENLLTRQSLMLVAVALLSISFEFWSIRKNLSVGSLVHALVPGSLILSYVAILSPWSLQDSYLLAITAPLIAFALLSIWQRFSIEKTWKLLIPIAIFAALLTCYRGYRGLGRFSDLREILYSTELETIVKKPHTIVMRCPEGAHLLKIYLQRFRGLAAHTLAEFPETFPNNHNVAVIGDSALCPIRPQSPWALVSTPKFHGSVALYILKNAEK